MEVIAYTMGLEVVGEYTHEAATGPTYSCGGTPASADIELCSVDVILAEEGDAWYEAVAEYVGQGTATIALGYARATDRLPTSVSDWLMSHYEDVLLEALAEAALEWEE